MMMKKMRKEVSVQPSKDQKARYWNCQLKKIRKNWILYLFVLPTLIWYILFCYLPMGGIYIAFTNYKGVGDIFNAKFVGLKWFKSYLNSAYASTTFINTLRLSIYSLLTFPIPIIMALFLNEIRSEKLKKVAQTIMYAPHFVSLVVMVSMMTLFMDSNGIINKAIETLGGKAFDFMGSSAAHPHIFVWSGVWQSLGWNSIIYLAALSGVDPALCEAATMDGCTRFKRILHIDLPTIAPTIIITLIMRVGSLMNVSTEKGILLRNTLNMATSETIGTFVYNHGLVTGAFSYATAVGLLLNVINLVLLLIVNKLSEKVTETSLF